MRGAEEKQIDAFSYVSMEERIPAKLPILPFRRMVNEILKGMDAESDRLCADSGRTSIAPEYLLRASILQILYSVRASGGSWTKSTSTSCSDGSSGWVKKFLSDEHFTVDGTLIEAWASMKSFQPKADYTGKPGPRGGERNPDVDFRGQERSNDTHESKTDGKARLYKKSKGSESKMAYLGHVLMENRNGLAVAVEVTLAAGTAERDAA
jgi:hypothetical protein